MKVPVHAVIGPATLRGAWLGQLGEGDAHLATSGCACCTARVEMQIGMARLIRERRPARLFVELADAAHLRSLNRVLGEWPLSQYVQASRAVRLPDDAHLNPAHLGDVVARQTEDP